MGTIAVVPGRLYSPGLTRLSLLTLGGQSLMARAARCALDAVQARYAAVAVVAEARS